MTDTQEPDAVVEEFASLDDLAAVEAVQKQGLPVEVYLPGTNKLLGKVLAPFFGNNTFQNRLVSAVKKWRKARRWPKEADIPNDVLEGLVADAGLGTLATDFWLFRASSGLTDLLPNRIDTAGVESYSDHELTDAEKAGGLSVHATNLKKIWGYEIVRRQVTAATEDEARYAAETAEDVAKK